jgi:hypothetical protein
MSAIPINLTAGEVLEVIYTDDNPNLVYGIKVKILDNLPAADEESPVAITAVPLNFNYIRVPIVGEIVLIIYAPSSYSNAFRFSINAYYLDIVSLQHNIHNNSLPTATSFSVKSFKTDGDSENYNESSSGNTNQPRTPQLDKNFSENIAVKSLQPYIGDVIISGRYGNSIRFSTTPKSGAFKVPPKYSKAIGFPISIYRNTTQSKDTKKINDFITEDFTNEENVIVQASGQELEFEQASGALTAIKKYKITSWKDEKWGVTPQTLISSGRIIFNSTQKEIIAFAKNGIGLSSETTIAIDAKESISLNAEKIELGTDSKEAIILGNAFKTWMENLILTLSTITPISPVGPCVPLAATPQWAGIESLKAQIEPLLLSEVAFTKKKAVAVNEKSAKFKNIPAPNFTMTEEEEASAEADKATAKEEIAKDLTIDEKNAWTDLHNKAEQEIKSTQKIGSEI